MKNLAETKIDIALKKTEGKARFTPNDSLAEVQKALRAAQAEAKKERQARIKAERALNKTQEKVVGDRLELEGNPQPQTRRVSFVVRLVLDEKGQSERVEIEHVSSGKKQNFLNLDGDQLVSFMKACVNPETTPEDAVSTKPH